ncbi:hypothetical protein BDC45DRAFT_441301, partial [Circinella umbellata]
STICQLCFTTVDTPAHFLVQCPLRWSVWTRSWRFFYFTVNPLDHVYWEPSST